MRLPLGKWPWIALVCVIACLGRAIAQQPAAGDAPVGAFEKAAQLAEAGKLQDALAEYERIVQQNSGKDLALTTEARFAKAALLERMKSPHDALNEYGSILKENRGKDMERAGEALYRGGLFASSPKYPGTLSEQSQALDTAYQLWRQLRDEFPTTAAARKIVGDGGPLVQLMDRIDKRNSADWKYQIIDTLVRATGKQPAFSYALALILLAAIVKLLLLPLTRRQYASMREMQRMQPYIKELQKKFKGSELSQKTMELYKEHKVNPFAGCFTGLLQVPFLILIFNAIREYEIAFSHGRFLWIGSPLAGQGPDVMGQPLVGLNLASPDVPLLALYVITNYVTMRMMPATDPQQQQQQNTMALMTSLLFFWMFLSYKWSSAFVLYWLALNGLSIWQQYEMIYKPHKARIAAGEIAVPTGEPNKQAPRTPDVALPSPTSPTTPQRVRPRRKKR